MIRSTLLMVICFLLLTCTAEDGPAETNNAEPNTATMITETPLFVGTYTRKEGHVNGKADGLYVMTAQAGEGQLTLQHSVPGIINPSFVFVAADGEHVYAVSETGPNDDTSSYVQAYSLAAPTQELRAMNQQPTHGWAACHVTGDAEGRFLFVANYMGGIAMLPIEKDGSIQAASFTTRYAESGRHPRQDASHPHSVNLAPGQKYAYVCDLGTDRIMIYEVDYMKGRLVPAESMAFAKVADGAGPRHMDFHPNGHLAFVINELDNSISVFRRDVSNGALELLETYTTLPTDYSATSHSAHIQVSPDGRFVYGSNRGHNSLVIYAVDATNGTLKLVGHESTRGDAPRHFVIDPNGQYLYVANQNSDTIIQFTIDKATGTLSMVERVEVPTPVCLAL